ncbi:MAG: hypothetical protein IH963_06485 [Chloroflexi bacterium]|nr:hypothetical protein [Chloroflexota bacterium]MCH8800538.1 hypothetical protein [Chloroflexota bacterium]
MRITKGKVVGGHVIVEGDPLDEGSTVTVLISDERTFTLSAEDEAALLQAISEADRDDLVDGDDVIKNIS